MNALFPSLIRKRKKHLKRNQDKALGSLIRGYFSSVGEEGTERCLSENEMAAFLENRLSRAERSAMDEHMAACARCRREAAVLVRAKIQAAPLVEKKKGLSFTVFLEEMFLPFRRPAVALATVSVAVLLAVFSTVLWQTSKPGALLAKAEKLLDMGEVGKAREICERVLASDRLGPKLEARAKRNLGLAFHKSALEDAMTGFSRKTTDPFPGAFTVALLTRSREKLPERSALPEESLARALENYEAALASAPGNVESIRLLASAYDDAGKGAEATALYERALEMEPSNPDVLNDYGVLLLRQEKMEEALSLFLKLHFLPQEPFGHLLDDVQGDLGVVAQNAVKLIL